MIHLQGCSRLPEFITDNDVINFSREEVPDTVRASPLTTSVSLQARSQRSVNGRFQKTIEKRSKNGLASDYWRCCLVVILFKIV